MKTNGNDPAHPHPGHEGVSGMSKREYFAAIAMQGLITNNAINRMGSDFSNRYAKESVVMADALIEALNKEE